MRCLFELYVDLKWLETFPTPKWVEKYLAFSNVDRYQAACKVVEHTQKHPDSGIDPKPYQKWIASADALREPVEQVVARVWGTKNGKPVWPKHHWTGIQQLSERAKEIGPACLDMYVELYSVLSWCVHSGPTAYHGKSLDEIEVAIGWSYSFAFQYVHSATIITTDLLGIQSAIPHFAAAMDTLWQRHKRIVGLI